MREWEKYTVGEKSTNPRWINPDCQYLVTIYHVTHLEHAYSMITRGSIQPGLVFDKSKLNKQRILVSWFSPNTWHQGSRYGNVSFELDFKSTVEGMNYYWVEDMTEYKPTAVRFLITPNDYDEQLDKYNPEDGDGPWYYEKETDAHFWNGEYCLEFMLESDVPLSSIKNISFVEHHYTKIGFSPMVSLVDTMPVYVSLRNGDAGARFQFYECLKSTLDLLDESKIQIGRVISDAAGYNTKAMKMLDDRGIKFNIRFRYGKKTAIRDTLLNWQDWRQTEIETANHFWNCKIASIPYKMYKRDKNSPEDKTYRLVVVRIPNDETRKSMENAEEKYRREQVKELFNGLAKKKVLKELQRPYTDVNWKQIGDEYAYKFFITNDLKKSEEEIVREYNKRGKSERNFSFLKRDFGWSLPPFMNLNENAVFLITAALANNLYRSFVKLHIKKEIPGLRLTTRLKEFIFLIISVSCEYLGHGVYRFYTKDKFYLQLME